MSFGVPVRNGLAIGLLSSTFLSTRRALPPPTLLLNFLAGAPLDSRITFTRASTATFVDSNGLIQLAAINAPRFDYNPTTLALNGLLMEEQRVNLLLNSDILGTGLSTQNVTVTAQSYTISFYGTGTITLLGAATQVVTGTGVYPSRITLTFTPTAGVLTCTVTGTVQYAQLEAGTFATSFIPTAATAVTRSADVASITGANFSNPVWYNENEGTFAVEASTNRSNGPSGRLLIADNSTSNNTHQILITGIAPSTTVQGATTTGGVLQAGFSSINVVGAIFNAVYGYKNDNFAFSLSGNAVLTDLIGTVPTGINAMRIGGNRFSTEQINGHLRTITYYPSRLTNAQIQALSS